MRNTLAKMRHNERVLIAVDVLLQSKSSFMSVFLMAFMMKVSLNDSPRDFIVYCIVRYALMGIFSALLINLFKRRPLFAWRFSMVFSVLEMLMVIFFSKWPGFIYMVSLFSGLESTLYWRPKIIFDTREISDDERVRFKSTGQIFTECVKIVMPIVIGLIVDSSSYERAGIFILIISTVQLLISFLFHPQKISIDHKKPRSIAKSIAVLQEHKSLQNLIFVQILRGLLTASAAYVVVATLSLNRSVDNNTMRGIATAVASFAAIIILSIYRKMTKKFVAQRTMLAAFAPAVILMPLLVYFFPDDPILGVVFYVFMQSVLASLLDSTVGVVRLQDILSRHLGNEEDRIVIEVIGEVFLSVGRIISLGILLVVTIFGDYKAMLIWVFLSSFAILPLIKIAIPSSNKRIRH